MNQIVTDVIEITSHTIRLATPFEERQWEVIGHGLTRLGYGFTQVIDSYSTLKEAQTDYPKAFCVWSETELEDCIAETADDFDWPSDTIPQ